MTLRRRRYFFASTLPSSTAGWSNGSTPSRCAAMIVSSMKCISSSPSAASSSVSRWMVRTGQPFLASVSAVARPCAATRSPMVLPAKSGSPRELGELGVDARAAAGGADRDDGEQLVARAGDEELKLAVLVDRAERGERRRALAVLAEAFGPELHVPAGEALQPVGIGHHHRDRLAAASATASAAPTAAGTSAGGLPASTGASASPRRRRGSRRCRGRRPRRAAGRRWSAPRSGRRRPDRGRASERRARPSRSRRPLALPGLAGSVMPRKWSCGSTLGGLQRGERRGGLHQRLAGAAGFRDRDEARGRRAAAAASSAPNVPGSRLSMKCRRGGSRNAPSAGHGVAGKLRQRLAAEARAAGAEEHHVGGALAQQRGIAEDRRRCRRASPAGAAAAACRRRGARAARRAPRRCAPARRRSRRGRACSIDCLSAIGARSSAPRGVETHLSRPAPSRSGPWAGRPP